MQYSLADYYACMRRAHLLLFSDFFISFMWASLLGVQSTYYMSAQMLAAFWLRVPLQMSLFIASDFSLLPHEPYAELHYHVYAIKMPWLTLPTCGAFDTPTSRAQVCERRNIYLSEMSLHWRFRRQWATAPKLLCKSTMIFISAARRQIVMTILTNIYEWYDRLPHKFNAAFSLSISAVDDFIISRRVAKIFITYFDLSAASTLSSISSISPILG